MAAIRNSFREILRYPSAIIGLFVIALLVFTAVYAVIKIPYNQAIDLWRGGESVWYKNPKFAPPSWFNLFTSKKEPISFDVNTANGTMSKKVTPGAQDTSTIDINYAFDYQYDTYPQEIQIYFTTKFVQKQPFVSIVWLTPDGRKIRIDDIGVALQDTLRFSQDERLIQRLKGADPMQALFEDPKTGQIIKGKYQVQMTGTTFEQGSDINAELVFQ